jgi:Protein of unknown function (DUF1640)
MLEQEARIAGFKSEVLKSQDMHQGALTRENERLANDLQKVRSEFRCDAFVVVWFVWFLGLGSCKLNKGLASMIKMVFGCRYEIDKLTASQRLDLNLEKGRMRDELQALRDKANELEIKIDKEVNHRTAAVEQTKNETIKYSLGMMLAFATAGLGAARLVSK